MPAYPIVEVPRALTGALTSFPFPLKSPILAPLPKLPTPAHLTWGTWLRLSCWASALVVLVAFGWETLALLLALLAASDVWWLRRRATSQYQDALAVYQLAFMQYLDNPKLVAAYEQAKAAAAMPEVIARYRVERIANVLTNAAPFQRIPADAFQPPKGRSEAHFAHYIQKNFGSEHLFLNCRVRVAEGPRGLDWYYPDLIYRDATGLCIDIEIDEPYLWSTGEPHHYIGQDDARNAFFLRHNWAVLRFTEEQVVRYPMSCCQVLAALIFDLTGQHYAPRLYRERLPPYPQWDWTQAKHLAASESRKSYQANWLAHQQRGEDEQ
jgi:hypothetical protein